MWFLASSTKQLIWPSCSYICFKLHAEELRVTHLISRRCKLNAQDLLSSLNQGKVMAFDIENISILVYGNLINRPCFRGIYTFTGSSRATFWCNKISMHNLFTVFLSFLQHLANINLCVHQVIVQYIIKS